MEDINPLVEVEKITHPGKVALEVQPPKLKNQQKWSAQQKNNQNKNPRLILPTVLMTRAANVEEVLIGHALAMHQRKWCNNTKHTRPLFIQWRKMIWKTGIVIQ